MPKAAGQCMDGMQQAYLVENGCNQQRGGPRKDHLFC